LHTVRLVDIAKYFESMKPGEGHAIQVTCWSHSPHFDSRLQDHYSFWSENGEAEYAPDSHLKSNHQLNIYHPQLVR
jgi:hypothetical protein